MALKLLVSRSVVGWVVSGGTVIICGELKSKKPFVGSAMSPAVASRCVSGGKLSEFQSASDRRVIHRRMDYRVRFRPRETTMTGTRKPVTLTVLLVVRTEVLRRQVVRRRRKNGSYVIQATAFVVGKDERGVRPRSAVQQGSDDVLHIGSALLNVVVRVLIQTGCTGPFDKTTCGRF